MIACKLNWECHVNIIKNKIAKSVGILSKARKLLHQSCLITPYYSFVYPLLTYYSEVWAACCKTRIEGLFKLQRRAVQYHHLHIYSILSPHLLNLT